MYSLQTFGILLVIFGYSVNGFLVPLQKYGSKPAPSDSVKFKNSYYKYHGIPKTWTNAREICVKEGGHLAIVNSQKESDFLVSLLEKNPASNDGKNNNYNNFVLIGFYSLFKKGEYWTVNGESLSQAGHNVLWAKGEPNNYNGKEYCGSFYRKGGLNDIFCDAELPFVCEIPSYDWNDKEPNL